MNILVLQTNTFTPLRLTYDGYYFNFIISEKIKNLGLSTQLTKFNFSENTEAYEAFSVIFDGQMMLFGGRNHVNSISKVSDCGTEKIGTLPFN